jgi:hypothetical protein
MSGLIDSIVRRRRASASSRLGPPPQADLPPAPQHVNGTAPPNGGPPEHAHLNGAAPVAEPPPPPVAEPPPPPVAEPPAAPVAEPPAAPVTEPPPAPAAEPPVAPAPAAEPPSPSPEPPPPAVAPQATEASATNVEAPPQPEVEAPAEPVEEPGADDPAPIEEPEQPEQVEAPTAADLGAEPKPAAGTETEPPPFVGRGRIRRRARYLRRLREVQLRDLGGFIVELRRFEQNRPELIQGKLESALRTDAELRALESALGSEQPFRELREAGIGGVCAHCGSVHGTSDRFCSACGEPLSSDGEDEDQPQAPDGAEPR